MFSAADMPRLVLGALRTIAPVCLLLLVTPSHARVRITEALVDPIGNNVGNQKIELSNTGDTTVDIGGWWICGFFSYRQFPAGVSLAPGATYVIHVGASGTNDAQNYYTGAFPTLSATDDAFSLYNTNSFSSPSAIEDFVQWGAVGQARESTAISGGVWVSGEYVPVPPEGESIQICSDSIGSSGWLHALPNLGGVNNCPVPTGTTSWSHLKIQYR